MPTGYTPASTSAHVHQPPAEALAGGGRAEALITAGEARTHRASKGPHRTAPLNQRRVTEGEQSPGPTHPS